ncbi:hypothetical protein AAFF_G00332920 [Aldrovandia affinis]|uniref:MARVEL domain-containing protein n=1 Tax=Aldrovandia affinis TaxID=143900 RepID=A0AAD7SM05_9TELE|nr:hypothetical protein AAFF_G00332920 [Aldrovandia affinis]
MRQLVSVRAFFVFSLCPARGRANHPTAPPQSRPCLGRGEPDDDIREMAPQPQPKKSFLEFLKSVVGVLRVMQIVLGAGLWVTIAANKYEGPIHFVLFVAVLFWLLTLALFFLTLLDKQDLVPIVGGERWLLSNLVHDLAATALYLPAIGIMIHRTERNSFCNLEHYKHYCPYKVYLVATVFACLSATAYLISAVYGSCRKCKAEAESNCLLLDTLGFALRPRTLSAMLGHLECELQSQAFISIGRPQPTPPRSGTSSSARRMSWGRGITANEQPIDL